MGLAALIDAVRSHLGASLTAAPALLGGAVPADGSDLPAVALEVNVVARQREGMGRVPGPTRTGALRVTATIDLADPVLHFPGDPPETVTLLTNGRRTLLLPHGTVVRADGLSDQPFAPSDLVVRRGNTTFTPVAGPPGPTEVQLDPVAGTLALRERAAGHRDGAARATSSGPGTRPSSGSAASSRSTCTPTP